MRPDAPAPTGARDCSVNSIVRLVLADARSSAALTVDGLRHSFAGSCPDPTQPDSRDPECPACARLIALAAATPQHVEPASAGSELFWEHVARAVNLGMDSDGPADDARTWSQIGDEVFRRVRAVVEPALASSEAAREQAERERERLGAHLTIADAAREALEARVRAFREAFFAHDEARESPANGNLLRAAYRLEEVRKEMFAAPSSPTGETAPEPARRYTSVLPEHVAAAHAELRAHVAAKQGVAKDEADEHPLLLWLTARVLDGDWPPFFTETESGDIGVFVGDPQAEDLQCAGRGESATAAIESAMRRWVVTRPAGAFTGETPQTSNPGQWIGRLPEAAELLDALPAAGEPRPTPSASDTGSEVQ